MDSLAISSYHTIVLAITLALQPSPLQPKNAQVWQLVNINDDICRLNFEDALLS